MDHATPTAVDPVVDQGRHADPCAEIWYLTCRLRSADGDGDGRAGGELATQAILTTSPSGRLFVMASILDLVTGATQRSTSQFAPADADIADSKLDIRAPAATLRGSTDELFLRASIGDDGFALDLGRNAPVLYACGTGEFPYFQGPTRQYAFPALTVSGTVDLGGVTRSVTGGGWYDRQWSASRDSFGTANPFTWFGLCLDGGDNLSVWSAGGRQWATVVHPDGTHTVTAVTVAEQPGRSRIAVPFLDADLDVAHQPLHDDHGFYSGVGVVAGSWRGAPAGGYGFIDKVSGSVER
jgi:hypothetical protein